MRRALGITFGVLNHVLFAVTVWYLYWFLKGRIPESVGTVWFDWILATQFVVVHSLLLHPAVRERLDPWINGSFYGCFYCTATCLGLLTTIFFWQPGTVWWELTGVPRVIVEAAFIASWGALLYSLSLTGLGYQTGWTPFWHWLHGRPPPPRPFHPRGAYRWLRHPVYLSFLGLVWFTPVMTADRAILTAVWTAYIFVGSWLKDERLAYYIGAPYREYQAQVPGYPGMLLGPLGRVPRPVSAAAPPRPQYLDRTPASQPGAEPAGSAADRG